MIVREDLPEMPDWQLPPRESERPTIPETIQLGEN